MQTRHADTQTRHADTTRRHDTQTRHAGMTRRCTYTQMHIHTDTTDRCTYAQTRQTDAHTHIHDRQMHIHTDTTDRCTYTQIDVHTHRQADRNIHIHIDTQVHAHTHRHIRTNYKIPQENVTGGLDGNNVEPIEEQEVEGEQRDDDGLGGDFQVLFIDDQAEEVEDEG